MTSVMADAPFVKTTLTYTTLGSQTGVDADGNPTFSHSSGTLEAFVSPDRAAQLHRAAGADPKLTPVKIELVNPLTLPDTVGVGSQLTLVWAGRPATITITSVVENDIIGVDFGTFMRGDMLHG